MCVRLLFQIKVFILELTIISLTWIHVKYLKSDLFTRHSLLINMLNCVLAQWPSFSVMYQYEEDSWVSDRITHVCNICLHTVYVHAQPRCFFFVVCSENQQLCSRDVASYSLGSSIDGYSELRLSVRKETSYDVFCIQSQNRESLMVFIWIRHDLWLQHCLGTYHLLLQSITNW